MDIKRQISQSADALKGKTVAITGSTGGLGKEICTYLASLGADLVLLDRNQTTSTQHRSSLNLRYPSITVSTLPIDLEDMKTVIQTTDKLKNMNINVFIHNAGAYSIPRRVCNTGYDNVFQINFVSPYYMIRELLPQLRDPQGRVIAVGSIAHNYSKTDKEDVDFKSRKASSKVYGNAKRFLMFSLLELFKNEDCARLSIVHPGITLTNITAHYPKWLYAIIKHPMKVIFMSPKKAALSVVAGLFDSCSGCEWIGPRVFDVWGLPKKKKLNTCGEKERKFISLASDSIYQMLKK